jgi:hypothetical protein
MSGDSTNHTPILWQAMSAAWIRILLLFPSLLVSGVVVAAALQHIVFLDTLHALLPGLIATALLSGVLVFILPRLAQELQVCDPSLRHIIIGLIAGGMVVVFFSTPAPAPHTLTWHWDAGQQAGAPAPVFSGASWDGVNRSVIELHATDDSNATLYGVWRAEAALDEIAGMRPARVELWLTQPSWAVIDPATGNPGPNVDGVDVTISVQREQETLLERHIALDPPAIPEQRAWHNVVLNLPPDSERLVVDVQMRKTLDSDRVWVTEAVVRPAWNSMLDQAALVLIVAFAASTLAFAGRLPQIVSVSRRVSAFFSNYGYLLVGVACLWLGYLLVWQRGLYLDDYSLKNLAVDLITGDRRPIFDWKSNPNFPARLLTWIVLPQIAALVPDHELIVRILMALITGINAFLLGFLVYKMTTSWIGGTIAGWGFLVHPHNEVPFWIGTGGYLLATMFIMISLIALWLSLEQSSHPYLWIAISVISLLSSYMFSENGGYILILLPIFVLIAILRQSAYLCAVKRAIVVFMGFVVITVFYVTFVASSSAVVQNRGGLDINPGRILQRVIGYIPSIYWIFITFGLYGEAFSLGITEISNSWFATLALGCIVGLVFLSILTWKSKQYHDRNIVIPAIILVLLGVVWTLSSLSLPYALAPNQVYERRFFYQPTAGVATTLSGVTVLLISMIRKRFLEQVVVAGGALTLLLASICTLGFARTYAERNRLDELQLETLRRTAPSEMLPLGTFIVPYLSDERLFGRNDGLSMYVFGVMETPWSAYQALRMIYKRNDLMPLVANRWAPMRFSVDLEADPDHRLRIQGRPVPVNNLLMYQYRDGKVYIITRVTLQTLSGKHYVFDLPLAQKISEMGSPAIHDLVIRIDDTL